MAVYVVMVLVMGAVAVLYCTAGLAVTVRAYTLLAHAPSLLLLLFFSRFRGWRMLFQLMSAILFCMLTQHAAGLVYYLSGQRFWVMALSYAVLTVAVICFLVRFLRPLFFQTLEGLRHGWWLACLAMGALLWDRRLRDSRLRGPRPGDDSPQARRLPADGRLLHGFDAPLHQHPEGDGGPARQTPGRGPGPPPFAAAWRPWGPPRRRPG